MNTTIQFETGISFFCLVVLAIIIVTDTYVGDTRPSGRYLRRMYLAAVAYLVCAIVFYQTNLLEKIPIVNEDPSIMLHFMIAVTCSQWVTYVFVLMDDALSKHLTAGNAVKALFLLAIPLFAAIVLLDDFLGTNVIPLALTLRNVVYSAFILLPLYILVAFIVYVVFVSDTTSRRRDCYAALAFVIPLIVSIHADFILDSYAIVVGGITVGLFVVFFNTQSQMITNDPLTGIGNVPQIKKQYLSMGAEAERTGKHLYFAITDLDDFRLLNEKYGMAEGDRILHTVGDILTQACGLTGAFVGREGGDEFVILDVSDTDDEMRGIIDRVEELSVTESKKHPYEIGISIGMVQVESGTPIGKSISDADEVLAVVKAERKSKKRQAVANA